MKTIWEKYEEAIKALKEIANSTGSDDKRNYKNEYTEADAFRYCKNIATKALAKLERESALSKSEEEIVNEFHTRFHKDQIVKHFKREKLSTSQIMENPNQYLYKIDGIVRHTETKELYVQYTAMYGDKKGFIRPLEMFLSEVDHDKYPEIKQKYRLEGTEL